MRPWGALHLPVPEKRTHRCEVIQVDGKYSALECRQVARNGDDVGRARNGSTRHGMRVTADERHDDNQHYDPNSMRHDARGHADDSESLVTDPW